MAGQTEKRSKRAAPARAARRQRLNPEDRERMIVEGAVRYFAANGFDGDTRALAQSLGVSQALIFHYFPTKEDLIDRVYEEVFLSRWKPSWEQVLGDRDRALRKRLKEFYRDYYETANHYEWIRITLYSALRDIDINARHHHRVRTRLIHLIVRELREELSLGDPESEITLQEEQLIYNLHSAVIYQLIRSHVYNMPQPLDMTRVIDAHVDLFMDSVPLVLHRLQAEAAKQEKGNADAPKP